jgi:hypothetical protein
VLHLKRHQIPATRGLAIVKEVASRAVSAAPADARAFETPAERLVLMAQWANRYYGAAD